MIASRSALLGSALALLGVLGIGALAGAFIALGSTQLSLLAIGGVLGLFMLFVPSTAILTLLLALAFFGVGVGMYYLGVAQMHWLPYALSMFLWMKLPIDRLGERFDAARRAPSVPIFLWALYVYFGVAIVSSVMAELPPLNWLVGGKNTIFIWSICFLVASASVSERYLRYACYALLAVATLQAPFAVTQHFGAFALRGNWDAVVGTFGGDPEGGGGSGLMAIFLSVAIGWAVVLVRDRHIGAPMALVVAVSAVVAIMMAETKVFFVLLPLMLVLVLARDAVQRPGFVLGAVLLASAFLVGVGVYYKDTYFSGRVDQNVSSGFGDYLNYALQTDSKVDFINPRTGEVGRSGAPLIWLKQAGFGGPQGYAIGYGMTSTRVSQTIGIGTAARRFQFMLATSSLSVLLWEVGALGTLAFVAMLISAAVSAQRLSRSVQVPPMHRSMLGGMAAALVVLLATVPYNNALVDGPALQVLLAFILGYVLRWHRQVQSNGARDAA
jgi:hypothetical protein